MGTSSSKIAEQAITASTTSVVSSAVGVPLGTAIASLPLRYYGNINGTGGDPSNPESSRARAAACTDDDNTRYMLSWVQSLRAGDWRPCDVGDLSDGRRAMDATSRVCEVAPASAWVTDDNLMFEAAGALLVKSAVDVSDVEFHDFEVLRYGPGSFFAAHTDRPRSKDHLGTLLAVVATEDAAGGELHVGDVSVGMDKPYLTFIPLGRLHSVTAVTAGSRYVAKAAVYGTTTDNVEANKAFLSSNRRCD
jgi:hypothetical protein